MKIFMNDSGFIVKEIGEENTLEGQPYIDPPSGWKYGFPKIAPKNYDKRDVLSAWLIEQGYPKNMIELALKYSRYWKTEK